MKDLTSKFTIKSAEQELMLDPGVMPMGYSVGGISAFNSSFKRGYGVNTFGIDERGLWLGAADFEDAPFKVNMQGQMIFTAQDEDDNQLVIDAVNLRIVLYIAGVPQALWGYQLNGF